MSLHQKINRTHMWLLGGVCGLTICTSAFADDCLNLAENAPWNEGMTTLSGQMTEKQWDDALKTAESLNTICERSPILNYAMGRIYREKGDDKKALYYMQRATLFTEEFAVKGKTLEQMWFDRYESEHPEARPAAIAAREKELEQRTKEVEELTTENLRLQGDVKAASQGARADLIEDIEAERGRYAAGMWTGVAVAGVGLVLTGVGAGMIIANRDDTIGFDDGEKDEINNILYIKPYTKGTNNTYWGLLGAGIAATVVGATVAGLLGYWYTHTGTSTEADTVSFYSTANGIGIRF